MSDIPSIKTYVHVSVDFDDNGRMHPTRIRWEDGTQYEIDRWETSQRSIDREVDMSAVSVNLIEDRPSDTAQADLSLWERIVAGLHASVEGMGEFLRDLAVFLAVALPWAVPVIVILVIIRIIRKRKKAS